MSLPCLYTTVKNISGASMHFGFLPPHGVTLAEDAELSLPGDLTTRLASQHNGARQFAALETALTDGLVSIIKTPAVIMYDPTAENSKQLALDTTVLGTVSTCWSD